MTNTIAAVMRAVRNFFERDCIEGEFTISGGVVSPAVDAPYVYISGSNFHDGVRKISASAIESDNHPSETFTGRVWLLHPPDDFLALCERIAAYQIATPVGSMMSETLNEYSYTRQSNGKGSVQTWQDAFSDELIPYRRMFTGVG